MLEYGIAGVALASLCMVCSFNLKVGRLRSAVYIAAALVATVSMGVILASIFS